MKLHLLRATTVLLAILMVGLLGSAEAQDKDKKDKTENEKTEAKAKVGEKAPDFKLTDTEGNEHTLSAYLYDEKVVVLEWFNPDCPFVKKHHKNTQSMAETYAVAEEAEVVWLAINSGGPGKQGAGLKRNQEAKEEYGIAYPVLLDESGEVGRAYGAKTTPHMFLIDKDGTLLYIGAIDNVPNPTELGDVNYMKKALGECAGGKEVETSETKSYGCSVKYAS